MEASVWLSCRTNRQPKIGGWVRASRRGAIGPLPEWVRVLPVAQEMDVAPWELIRRKDPDQWIEWALSLKQVRNEAQDQQTKATS